MPLVRIDIPAHTPPTVIRNVSDLVHEAMVGALGIPVADRFQTVSRRASDEMVCTDEFLGITHSQAVVMIQITLAPRSTALKQALFMAIASEIEARTPFKAKDVIIHLVETSRENWSFGNGIAQFA